MIARKPKHLGDEGELLWDSITAVHADLGPEKIRLLTDACREADIVERLEDAQRSEDLMMKGSQGQMVSSPLVSEMRQHRSVLAGLLKGMNLPLTGADSQMLEQRTSEQARAAARTRWDKNRLKAV